MGHDQMLRVTRVEERLDQPPAQADRVVIATGVVRLIMMPPGTRGMPHFHADETALYIVSGETDVWHGAGPGQPVHGAGGRLPLHPAGRAAPGGEPRGCHIDRGRGRHRSGRFRRRRHDRTASAPGGLAEPADRPGIGPGESGSSSAAGFTAIGAGLRRWCSSVGARPRVARRAVHAKRVVRQTQSAAGRRRSGCGRRRPGRCGGPAASTWPGRARGRASRNRPGRRRRPGRRHAPTPP